MKRIILPFLISFIILITANISYADIATKAKVNVTAVRIRESASTQGNIIKNIYQDDEIEVLEENGEWYKVKYGDTVGYAKAEFFTITQQGDLVDNPSSSENSTNEIEAQNNVTEESVVNNTESETTVNQNVATNQETTETTIQELNVGDIINIQNSLKIRKVPNFSSDEKYEILQGSVVIIDAKLGNWYKITDEAVSGWVTKSKLSNTNTSQTDINKPENNEPENTTVEQPKVEEQITEQPVQTEQQQTQQPKEENETTTKRTGIVIVETARVRSSASSKSNIIDTLDEDDIVTILAEEGDFYKITSSKISSGYISKSLVREKDVTSRSITEERDNIIKETEKNEELTQSIVQENVSVTSGNDIVEFAKQFLGYSYVLGCSTPEKGFDCSGFTRYVYGHFGYSLGQVAADQTSLGEVVERSNLQIGDLILFYNDAKTKIGHCGIFIGNNNFIHSANPQRGVVIDNLNTNSYYSERFVTARRIAGG